MVYAWIENGLWAEKEYSYDRSWGRSAVVMVVKAFYCQMLEVESQYPPYPLTETNQSCTCFNLSIFVLFGPCPPSRQEAKTSRDGLLDLNYPDKTSPWPALTSSLSTQHIITQIKQQFLSQ